MPKLPAPTEPEAVPRLAATFPRFKALPSFPLEKYSEWLESAWIQPVSAIEWQCAAHWKMGPRTVQDSMYFWIIEGTGWGEIQGLGPRFRMEPGGWVLMPEGLTHTLRQDPGQVMKVIAVHFHAKVYGALNLLELLGYPAYIPPKAGNEIIDQISKELCREFAVKAPGRRSAMQAQLLQLFIWPLRERGAFFNPVSTAQSADWPRLLPVLSWIEQNLEDSELSIAQLAKRVHLSEVQFRKIFRRAVGQSPTRFIQRRRIQKSSALLINSLLTVEQISVECGFNDPAFFNRIFKTHMGISPGNFRKRNKELFV